MRSVATTKWPGDLQPVSMRERILQALEQAGTEGLSRLQLRDAMRAAATDPTFRNALHKLVQRGPVVKVGPARWGIYYASQALADASTRVAQPSPKPAAGSPVPLPPRRPGWESIHRTVAQPPARVPAPSGGVVWPDHVQVQRLPSPPAHSRYHVPPEAAAAAPGSFTSEWARLRAGGSRRA